MFASSAALKTVHLKKRGKPKKFSTFLPPLSEWKKQTLNKLKLYKNSILKKAEIAPIR